MAKLSKSAAIFLLLFVYSGTAFAGTLTCSISSNCASGTVILRLSDTTNAHAELPSQSNYSQGVCCTGVIGLGTSCSGTYATVLKLSGTTNAHAEQNSETNYANSACLSVPTGGTVSVGYQSGNCSGYDTTIGSMTGTTNAHVGEAAAYSIQICATATEAPQTLTFSISDNTVGFGILSPSAARYATGDLNGSSVETEAHTLTASTNASNGYYLFVNGSTLSYGSYTITAIGSSNTASAPGTEQFGLRLLASGGNGAVSAPYNGTGFALDTDAFPDLVAQDPDGDDIPTTYSVHYLANISTDTEAGSYSAALNYLIVGKF